ILTGASFGLEGARDLETVRTLDRYTELVGKYPRTKAEEEELRRLATTLELELPPPESQQHARQAYEIIARAIEDRVQAVPEEERKRLSEETRGQMQEIVTGERRPS